MKKRVVRTKGILGGRPRVNGTRIGVEHVMIYSKGGATTKEIIRHYPDLTKEDIEACIEYSKKHKENKKRRVA